MKVGQIWFVELASGSAAQMKIVGITETTVTLARLHATALPLLFDIKDVSFCRLILDIEEPEPKANQTWFVRIHSKDIFLMEIESLSRHSVCFVLDNNESLYYGTEEVEFLQMFIKRPTLAPCVGQTWFVQLPSGFKSFHKIEKLTSSEVSLSMSTTPTMTIAVTYLTKDVKFIKLDSDV